MMSTRRKFNLWVLIKPCADVSDQWLAHCLDLDVVTQGNSPSHAIEMAYEACAMVLGNELAKERDPLARRAADEEWEQLYGVLDEQRPIKLLPKGSSAAEFDAHYNTGTLAVQLEIAVGSAKQRGRMSSAYRMPLGFSSSPAHAPAA